jgi:Alpha-glutamyl/putrescinyl thymine pyrophosphorylase clade 3
LLPTFCRHNHLVQNCTICARELNVEARPIVSSSAPKSTQPREHVPREGAVRPARNARAVRSAATGRSGGAALKVRKLARGAEDGYRCALLPGLKSSEDAERLAQEIAFSARRLELMGAVAAGELIDFVPEVWSEIAHGDDLGARTDLAFATVVDGPRGATDEQQKEELLAAYSAWTERSGSSAVAFAGESAWTPERRFERLFERLQFGGLGRDTRFEVLTLLGRLRVYELQAGKLFLTGQNEATWAAKRALGIGDALLLERRASDLARACSADLDVLDLALHNWGAGARIEVGLPLDADGDEQVLESARSALGL